jgi:hypothetical protein
MRRRGRCLEDHRPALVLTATRFTVISLCSLHVLNALSTVTALSTTSFWKPPQGHALRQRGAVASPTRLYQSFYQHEENEDDEDDDEEGTPIIDPLKRIEEARIHNQLRTDFRLFLTQRAIQSFIFLLQTVRDPHTVKWLEVCLLLRGRCMVFDSLTLLFRINTDGPIWKNITELALLGMSQSMGLRGMVCWWICSKSLRIP